MPDRLRRYIHVDGQFKVAIAETSGVGRAFYKQQAPAPLILHLMTQALTGAVLLATSYKDEGSLVLRLNGDGPAGHLTAEANTMGQVRGFAGDAEAPFDEHAGLGFLRYAIGDGQLTVVRKALPYDQVFQSVVPLVKGELALNLASYLLQSEQIPSAIQLGVSLDPDEGVAGAGGILVQALPDANEHLLLIIEDRLSQLEALGAQFSLPNGHDRVVDLLFEGMDLKLLAETDIELRCNCTRERLLRILAGLPATYLEELRAEDKPHEIKCSYCTRSFTFSPEDLAAILNHKQTTP